MANARSTHRCTNCDENWPYIDRYLQCPTCQQETYETVMDDVLTPSNAVARIEAHQAELKRLADLDRQLDEWEIAHALASLDDELGSLLC